MNAEPAPDDSTAQAAGPVTAATDRILATAATFDDAALRSPSLCAGWTRAHVLAHVARNADALTNLLSWARTGREKLQYPSSDVREADIEAGAQLPAAELLDDLHASAARFTTAVMDMPDHGWQQQVRPGASGVGDPIPGRRVLWLRLRELEIHHVDLASEYGPHSWPAGFVRRALPERARTLARRDDVPAVTIAANGAVPEHLGQDATVAVKGPPPTMLAWLIGRSSGDGLIVEPPAALPIMPPWL